MSRRRSCNLGARLLRTRALSVCLGERSFHVHPCDLSRGRPPAQVSEYLRLWDKGYRATGEYDDRQRDADLADNPLSVIMPDCVDYLIKTGSPSGWFTITERARILGSHVSIRVRDYDVLVTAGSLFGPANSCFVARNSTGDRCKRFNVSLATPESLTGEILHG